MAVAGLSDPAFMRKLLSAHSSDMVKPRPVSGAGVEKVVKEILTVSGFAASGTLLGLVSTEGHELVSRAHGVRKKDVIKAESVDNG